MSVTLEHANITVADAKACAEELCSLFDWHIRWEGASIYEGYSVHVGAADSYLALYSPKEELKPGVSSYTHKGGFNHVGLVVQDLDAMEDRVRKAGFEPHSHADYEPGRRFYFDGPGGVEFELVQYD